MADPLSIAASIAGVATAGFAIAKGLYRISDGIGSSGIEVRAYGDEIAAFAKVLSQLRTEVLNPTWASPEVQSLVDDAVHLCDRILEPVKAMLKTLSPLLERFDESKSKLGQFGLRVQWIFSYKEKLLFYRSALNSQHRLLQTLLDLIILQATKDRSPQNICILHISLQQSAEMATRTIYGSQYESSRDKSDKQTSFQSLPEGSDDEFQRVMGRDTHFIEQLGAKNPVQQLEKDTGLSRAVALYKPLSSSALAEEEVDSLAERIDLDLDPDNKASIMGVVRDISIITPRVLHLAAKELKSHDSEVMFDHQWEERARTAKPLEGRRPPRYTKALALLLHWGCDDLFVLPELEDLERCLREDYNMETEVYPIPSKAPHVELMLKVALFVKEHGSRDTLLVVYYGGHAMISESRQSVWKATRHPDAPQLNFSSIQTLFEDGQSDVLILLDCSSGAASAGFPDGDNLVETICASSWGADAPDPGRYSFTNSLIEVLQEWRGRKFSATMLHAEILSRLKHPRPITINGKVFEARSTPVHFVQTSNFSAPSIEVSSMAPKRHEPGGSSHDRVENAPITVTMRTRGGK